MFRLLFLTFFGEYRGAVGAGLEHGAGHSRGAHGDSGHSHIHESPKVMLVPLVILAILSVVGGWVGIPGSLGGGNRFEKFLAPVFHATTPAINTEYALAGEQASPEKQTEGAEPQTGGGTELMFTGISVAAAAFGLLLAWLLYLRNPELPEKIADALSGFYEAVLNKYYIDELYATLFVRPLVDGSARILWRGIDQDVIDRTVNDGADGARHVSDNIRHMQSGNLRSYAGWVAAGGAVVIAYMVWVGTR
jgi:NADH-quinone oxidoreductase subunit L